MKTRYILADTETSGLGKDDGVCEICWWEISPDLSIIEKVHSLIDPGKLISPGASGVHGIVDADVADAPTIEEFFSIVRPDEFKRDGERVVFIAHNAPFDLKFFKPYIGELAGTICTLRLARRYYPDLDNHKLQTIRYALGLGSVNRSDALAHSADGDVMICYDLLVKLVAEHKVTLDDLVAISPRPLPPTKMPFGKHKGTKLVDLPLDYVQWLLKQADIDSDLRAGLLGL